MRFLVVLTFLTVAVLMYAKHISGARMPVIVNSPIHEKKINYFLQEAPVVFNSKTGTSAEGNGQQRIFFTPE